MTPAVRSSLATIGAFSASLAASLGIVAALEALGAPVVAALFVGWCIGAVILAFSLGAVISAGRRS
jgi:uncharacterized membrane protein HdeD (DUF308 family)